MSLLNIITRKKPRRTDNSPRNDDGAQPTSVEQAQLVAAFLAGGEQDD